MIRSKLKLAAAIAFAALATNVTIASQRPIEIALYDIEHLYDTIDVARTQHNMRANRSQAMWTTERYRTKIENTAQVLDSIAAPMIAILGVESEEIVRDLVMASQMEYCYIYRALNYFDDLDCALLYHGDYLVVERVETANYLMVIHAVIDNQKVVINITRRGNKVRNITPTSPDIIAIAAGNLSHADLQRLDMDDPLHTISRQGAGDTYSDRGWYFNTRLGVYSDREYKIKSGVFSADWLMAPQLQRPLPTYLMGHYVGGYSSHLPTYIRITTL